MNPPGGGVAKSVELALNSKVNNETVKKLFNIGGKGESPKALFKRVDTRVRKGDHRGQDHPGHR